MSDATNVGGGRNKSRRSKNRRGRPPSRRNDQDDADMRPPSSVARKEDDGPEFSPATENRKKPSTTIPKGGAQKESSYTKPPSVARRENDGPEFSPATENRKKPNTIIPKGGAQKESSCTKPSPVARRENDGPEFSSATEKRKKPNTTNPKGGAQKESSCTKPSPVAQRENDGREFSPATENRKKPNTTITEGGAQKHNVARLPLKEQHDEDEKIAAKASITSGQRATVPGAVSSSKQPPAKSLKGHEEPAHSPESICDIKIQSKSSKSKRKLSKSEKNIVVESNEKRDTVPQPEAGSVTVPESEVDTLSSSRQPANETTGTSPRRPRAPESTTVIGAVRVAGLDGDTGSDDMDDGWTQATAPASATPDDGRSKLPVATMADDPSQVFLDDLGQAEPLSPDALKNQGVRGWIRQHKLYAGIAVLVVIGTIVGGAVGGTLGGSPPPEPTLEPTFAPTSAPTLDGFEQFVDTLTTITSYSTLTDPTTPQNAALTWLMRQDEYEIDAADSPKLLQRYALATIYFATVGANWTRQLQFLTNQDDCLWNEVVDNDTFGVRECNDQGLATKLALSQNGLQGTIPDEVTGMPMLVEFGAAANSMSGTIPEGLMSLTNLLDIFLFESGVSGTIPQDIGSLTKLTHLALHINELTGTVPLSLYALANLESLFLHENDFSGTLPTEVGNLALLQRFWLRSNQFSGSVPSDVAKMTSLVSILMQDNDFRDGMENFCTDNIDFVRFEADCFADGFVVTERQVECSCCTVCCFYKEFSNGCLPNDGSFIPS